MAAQLERGAYLSSFVGALLNRLSSLDVNSIPGRKADQDLLQRLKTSLHAVRLVLGDAEPKQIKDQEVKKWLVDLQDAVYMADDLLDEVSTKAAIATQRDTGNSSWSQYVDSELEDSEMAIVNRMEHIVKTLESIVKLKDGLGLEKIAEGNMSWRIPSTSLVESSDIYGRDEDKESIIKLLLDDTCDAKMSVIPIVGMGGVGKTTLAQLVYNDDKVKGKFDCKAWVCVAEKFDVINVTKTIIEAITSCPCNMNNFDLLQTDLKEKLIGKTFLIVLDDVWNDQPKMWNTLLKPIQYGNKGSKILLTTRNEKVASSVMPTIQPYQLRLLSDEDCWLVFLKHSFLSTESKGYAALEQIGRKIVKKCKGLPLAVETLGGLLCTKYDVKDWNNILKSEIWEFSEDESSIIPALRISYHYLPSHLKRCFVHCSLYPKDYQFDKDELILLWMAEDLLLQSKGKETLEELGCVYFNELVARSFFQPFRTSDSLFVMHDLVHDLATFCAREFYFRAEEPRNAAEISIKTRHLSYNAKGNDPISKLLQACDSVKHIRTFLVINLYSPTPLSMKNDPCILLPQLKHLRVLSYKHFHLKSVVDSIGELIHLRYLNLSYAPIVTLPESLSKLYNLQILKLRGCSRLEMLPSGMQDLVNLRHLDIRGTFRLKEMPKGMSKLKHLNFLSDYIVSKHEENSIKELGALKNLHGSLYINKLENVINSGEAFKAKMVDKKHINILELNWFPSSDIVDSQIERDIFDKLRPHGDLKELSIDGYRGKIFPDWLGLSSYHNMTKLSLCFCKNCCMLPSLGQLPSLKCLVISQLNGLEHIGSEFYRNDESSRETPFPSLESLEFHRMACWQVWRYEFDAFPQLKKLSIEDCPELTGHLPNHLPGLEKLTIRGCQQLACPLPRAPAIHELSIRSVNEMRMQEPPHSPHTISIEGSQLVESVLEALTHTQPTSLQCLDINKCSSAILISGDYLPASLEKLDIWKCEKLAFSMQQQHASLKSISVDCCDSLTFFSLAAFPNLRELKISNCENLKCLEVSQDDALSSLRSLRIADCPRFVSFSILGLAAPQLERLSIFSCPEIDSFPKGGLPLNLRVLCIRECQKLVRCLTSMDLHSQGLTRLTLDSCDDVESFPKEGCLPASLESLDLLNFPDLETLDCKGLLHLSSLKKLTIVNCPKLKNMAAKRSPVSLIRSFSTLPQLDDLGIYSCPEINSFPEGVLPPNLRNLSIGNCEKLVRCLASMDFHTHRLTDLHIGGPCESIKSFPMEGYLPASLRSLSLYNIPSLETLDCKGLLHLTSLQELWIEDCPKLENMVEEMLPASITKLYIRGSPLEHKLYEMNDP